MTQPKTCTKCGQRNVRKAYHVNCTECALKLRCCAKCNKSADEVNILPPEPSTAEQMKLDSEMSLLIKKLPERKRRTFLRYMKKGKKKDKEEGEAGDADGDGEDSDPEIDSDEGEGENEGQEAVATTKAKKDTIPYSKEELLKKLEQMKLALENDDEDFDEDDDFFASDYDDEDDSGEEEEEETDEEEEEKPVKKGVTFDKGVKK